MRPKNYLMSHLRDNYLFKGPQRRARLREAQTTWWKLVGNSYGQPLCLQQLLAFPPPLQRLENLQPWKKRFPPTCHILGCYHLGHLRARPFMISHCLRLLLHQDHILECSHLGHLWAHPYMRSHRLLLHQDHILECSHLDHLWAHLDMRRHHRLCFTRLH